MALTYNNGKTNSSKIQIKLNSQKYIERILSIFMWMYNQITPDEVKLVKKKIQGHAFHYIHDC